MPHPPVILLAFSNDEDAYLPRLIAEQKAIKTALLDHADRHFLHLRDIERASPEDIFYHLNRYHNRVQILHYGGHADGSNLQMEREIGVVQAADARGIAGLLGTQKDLKLVFLNGCATKGQVAHLLDCGVQAVIATSVSVQDDAAQQFAVQFYRALASGSTLREAFEKAKAYHDTHGRGVEILPLENTRSPFLRSTSDPVRLPWGLYWLEGSESILDWQLPTESPLDVDFSHDTMALGNQQVMVNQVLVTQTLKAVRKGEAVKELARKINKEIREGKAGRKPSDREKKVALLESFPAPISVHLRALFCTELAERPSDDRLDQLVLTYQTTVEFLALVMLSDLWDHATRSREPLRMEPDERRHLKAYFSLNEWTAPSYDFFLLGDALLRIADRNGIDFYLTELDDQKQGWRQIAALTEAHAYFSKMEAALEEDIPARLIEPYCLTAEQHLARVLETFHFLHAYRMAVIKNIEVQRIRNMPPVRYKHALVELDHSQNDKSRKDQVQHLPEPTDMESVLVYQDKLNRHLNLSPFVLDENALLRVFNFKVFFYAHRTETGLAYTWIENAKDVLEIRPKQFDYILEMYDKARRDLLNEQTISSGRNDKPEDDDIMSLL